MVQNIPLHKSGRYASTQPGNPKSHQISLLMNFYHFRQTYNFRYQMLFLVPGLRSLRTFLNQITDKFSWQVCKNFKELINKNALWRWYCLKKCTSLTLKQVNSFPSCKEFYREILKPFSFAVGHSFMFPGLRIGT